MGWFSRKPLVPAEDVDWLFDVYGWLLTHLGGNEEFADQELVLPEDEFFPMDSDLEGPELAGELFRLVREYAGMDDWPVRLRAHRDGPRVGDILVGIPHEGKLEGGAAGTFRVKGRDEVEIAYSPRTLKDPTQFIATMAHELAHYLMATIEVPPPGGDDAEEPATDVCCSFIGFGIFAANGAFNFSQFQDGQMAGWEVSRQGYLDEATLAYCLAIFIELQELDEREVYPFLKSNPRSFLKRALKHLQKERLADIERLRAIEGTSTD